MEIVAFDKDDKADGSGKAKITWISKWLLNTKHRMNPANDNGAIGTGGNGGWESSEMRTYLKNTIKLLIPDTVRNAIVPVTKIQSTVTDGTKVINGQTTTENVWIPSYHELYPNNIQFETNCATYTRCSSMNDRIKKIGQMPTVYWTRSANSVSTWKNMSSSGAGGDTGSINAAGVVLGFCT